VVLDELTSRRATLAVVEMFTGGQIVGRLVPLPGAERAVRRGVVSLDMADICAAVQFDKPTAPDVIDRSTAEEVARAARLAAGATHALAVLLDLDEGTDRVDFGASVCLAIASSHDVVSRRSRIVGGRDWVRLGAIELGLDCLRRYLQGLPVDERIDFEKQ
jgi:nicotinamide-nucleotide amidase